MQGLGFGNPLGRPIYTLAQNGTTVKANTRSKPVITVKGKGTAAGQTEVLQNRAKKKMITQKLIRSLVDVATSKGATDRVNAYWNTYYCQSRITKSKGQLYGDYCKNRFCTLCSGIRKAEIINKYLPIISTWQQPYFVTLTAKSVFANALKSRINRMHQGISKLLARNKKRAERGKEVRLMGIRSIECNFNPIKRSYNPHFHFIVATKEMAEILVREWLKQCTPTHARPKAQLAKPVENTEKTLIEVIKYGSKIFTDPTMKGKAKKKVSPYIYVSAFDNIIGAMQGHRIFDRFGFNLPADTPAKQATFTPVTDYETLVYDTQLNDWISEDTLEVLTGYKPRGELMAILENNVDMVLE